MPLHCGVRFTTSALTELSTEVAKSALKKTRWRVTFAQEYWKSPCFGGAADVWMIYCLYSQNKRIWPVVKSLIKELQMYRGSKVLCWINKQKWQQWALTIAATLRHEDWWETGHQTATAAFSIFTPGFNLISSHKCSSTWRTHWDQLVTFTCVLSAVHWVLLKAQWVILPNGSTLQTNLLIIYSVMPVAPAVMLVLAIKLWIAIRLVGRMTRNDAENRRHENQPISKTRLGKASAMFIPVFWCPIWSHICRIRSVGKITKPLSRSMFWICFLWKYTLTDHFIWYTRSSAC